MWYLRQPTVHEAIYLLFCARQRLGGAFVERSVRRFKVVGLVVPHLESSFPGFSCQGTSTQRQSSGGRSRGIEATPQTIRYLFRTETGLTFAFSRRALPALRRSTLPPFSFPRRCPLRGVPHQPHPRARKGERSPCAHGCHGLRHGLLLSAGYLSGVDGGPCLRVVGPEERCCGSTAVLQR